MSLRYDANGRPASVDAVVLSTQHDPGIGLEDLRKEVLEQPVCRQIGCMMARSTINPTGIFVIGGPVGDCGLTGRKIIVDTYGGMARHGGGAFSGKDPSKVDRSAAYAARYEQRISSPRGSLIAVKFKCRMRSVSLSPPQFLSIPLAPTQFLTKKLPT